jgi:hypothetical protein
MMHPQHKNFTKTLNMNKNIHIGKNGQNMGGVDSSYGARSSD